VLRIQTVNLKIKTLFSGDGRDRHVPKRVKKVFSDSEKQDNEIRKA
jgi:hypothetical protein